MNSRTGGTRATLLLAVGAVCMAFTLNISAQVQTKTSTAGHKATIVTKVERGEVVYVSGNDLVVKMEDGTLRNFNNVPESARITVDGKQLGIHDLKPGMKLQRTITTTSVSKTITTVQSVTGKVWAVNPPLSVILTLADGSNQQFKIPKNQKFNIDGQMVDAWGLKKGMTISATKIVEVPEVVESQHRSVTGTMPAPVVAAAPPPPPPPPDVPILVAVVEVPEPPAPAELPKTGSTLPLIGLLGLLSLASSLGLRAARKSC
ncbi:MAG: LPXTG cell wall anchor domain-containing protein [Terriglobales bacterium]